MMKLNPEDRAGILAEALPYIQEYYGETVVVKYGGNAMTSEELKHDVIRDIVLLHLVGIKVVLVHGGGPDISALLKKINKETGITIVIITHQMSVVREICHNVAIVQSGEIVERGLVEDIFTHPKSRAARQLVIEGKDPDEYEKEQESRRGSSQTVSILHESRKIRIVFGTQSSFEPVIANMILTVGVPVNILKASTQDVGGTARGDMILGLPADAAAQEKIISYLKERGLAVEEVD